MIRLSSQWWLVRAVVALTTMAFFAPLLSVYPGLYIPSPYPDALEFIWTTWRIQGVLEGTRELYTTQELFAPEGASLLLHTVCEGILIPVTFLLKQLDPVWRFNGAIILLFLANGLAAISFVRVLGGSPQVTTLASLLIVFAPFQMGHLLAGHLNFLVLFPLLEVCTTLVVFGRDTVQGRRLGIYALRLIFALFLLGRTNLYYLYFAGLLIIVFSMRYALVEGFVRTRLVFLWGIGAVGMVFNITHLYSIARLALSKRYTPDHDPLTTSADLLAYVVPSSLQLLGTLPAVARARAGVAFHEGETSLFLGAMLLVAAFISYRFRGPTYKGEQRFFMVLACSGVIVSLGPVVLLAGTPLFANPVDYLARTYLPLYPSVPARFGLIATLFLVGSAVSGSYLEDKSLMRRVLVVCLLLSMVEIFPSRYTLTELTSSSPALTRLRDDPSVKLVVDQPVIMQHAMLRQVYHEKPIVGGFLSRRPRKAEREVRGNPFVQFVSGISTKHSMNARRAAWCKLGADALLLEAPRAQILLPELAVIGLSMVDSDEHIWIFKPHVDLCGGTSSDRVSDRSA